MKSDDLVLEGQIAGILPNIDGMLIESQLQ